MKKMLRYCFYFLSLLSIVCVFIVFIQHSFDDEKQPPFKFPQKIDSSCVLANVIKRKEENPDRITLILHASSDRIIENFQLIEQVENWNAPVSLAIAFYDKDMIESIGCVSSFLRDIKNQSTKVNEFLSVHFLIENSKIDCNQLALKAVEPCFQPIMAKDENITAFEISTKLIKYPINKARNLGRKYASTKFILIADLDFYFSLNFELKMRNLANSILKKQPKTALVYRIFETKENATQPKTKTDLKNLMDTNEAFEFHHTFTDHSIQHLNEWFEASETSESNTSIQFYKEYDSPKWEPQFVSLSNIPLFDLGFRYPRRDNTVLRWEMCRAGYKFAIINEIFAYHKGLKSYKEMNFLNKVRRRLGKSTEEALGRFSDRMDLQYPKTKNKCPLITSKLNI